MTVGGTAAHAVAKPDFLVIGAQKCGTTWLHEMLHQHPDVFVPEFKEVNYFVRAEHNRHSRHHRGWDWYQSLYASHADKIGGDVTPDYIYWDYCARDVAERLIDVKVIAILRHPVERAYSQYWMSCRNLTHERSFEEMLEANRHLTGRSRYARQLQPWFDALPRDNILVLFYEELFADSVAHLPTIFRFIGADPAFLPKSAAQKIGGTVVYKGIMGKIVYKVISPIITHPRVLPLYRAIRHNTGLRELFVEAFAQRGGYVRMPTEVRSRLLGVFEEENRALERLLGRSVPESWWR